MTNDATFDGPYDCNWDESEPEMEEAVRREIAELHEKGEIPYDRERLARSCAESEEWLARHDAAKAIRSHLDKASSHPSS